MGKIVAIGGGSMEERETLAIDREIVRLTGSRRPRALFIPTASYDNPERYEIFLSIYGGELGCTTDALYLLGSEPSKEELEEKILSSDLIYVSGGNTLKLMRRWRRLGVDKILRTAHDKGIVLAGLSAGAICWFKKCSIEPGKLADFVDTGGRINGQDNRYRRRLHGGARVTGHRSRGRHSYGEKTTSRAVHTHREL